MSEVSTIGLSHPKLGRVTKVAFRSLKVDPERFQVRSPASLGTVQGRVKEEESRRHIAQLHEAIQLGRELDPVIVWPDAAGTLWVIDGHHRMQALEQAGTEPTRRVSVQRFTADTEEEARAFALEVALRDHINMDKGEVNNEVWLGILAEELTGVRPLASRFGVSLSTIQRMHLKATELRPVLEAKAKRSRKRFSGAFIRKEAPPWKEVNTYLEAKDGPKDVDREKRALDRLLTRFITHFGKEAKANPGRLLRAFAEFYRETTGRQIEVIRERSEDDDSDF